MSLSKLKQIHIIIIGSFLCIAAGAAIFFLMIKPQMEALENAQGRYDAAASVGTEANVRRAQNEYEEAQAKVADAQQMLDVQMKERMPDLSFEQRDRGMLALWQEQTRVLGPLLNNFARDRNVATVQANFQLPTPPWNPNDRLFDEEPIVIPLGQVVATGDFPTLMNNIRRWNNCRRLVMVSEPSLQMGETALSLQYTVTCYIFPVAKGGPNIPMAGQAGGAGADGMASGGQPMPPPPPPPAPEGGAEGRMPRGPE